MSMQYIDPAQRVGGPSGAGPAASRTAITLAGGPTIHPQSSGSATCTSPSMLHDTGHDDFLRMSSRPNLRIFKKSASEQHKHAKGLIAEGSEHLEALERELEQGFREATDPVTCRKAMEGWLSIQWARLSFHHPAHRTYHTRSQIIDALCALDPFLTPVVVPRIIQRRSDYYASALRPHYRAAFNNFLRVIGDDGVPAALRQMAEDNLRRHVGDGLIAFLEQQQLSQHGIRGLAAVGYRVPDRTRRAAQLANQTAADIAQQKNSLGTEIRRWMTMPRDQANAFNAEANADAFARLLGRLRPALGGVLGTGRKTVAEVRNIVPAIRDNPELRSMVFGMAEYALGTCGDNVRQGFANIATAVRAHQMRTNIRNGAIDRAQFMDWAHQQVCLSALEREVMRHCGDSNEASQKMLYAEVKLARALGLPSERSTSMRYRILTWIDKVTLAEIAAAVTSHLADRAAVLEQLRTNDIWRAGMRQLHADRFRDLDAKLDLDPFYDLPMPGQDIEEAQARLDYAEAASAVEQLRKRRTDELMDQLYAESLPPAAGGMEPLNSGSVRP